VGIANFALVCCCDLDLDPWPSYANLTSIGWRYSRRPKLNFPRQNFWQLSYYIQTDVKTDRQTPPRTLPPRFALITFEIVITHLLTQLTLVRLLSKRIICKLSWPFDSVAMRNTLGLASRLSGFNTLPANTPLILTEWRLYSGSSTVRI